MIFLVLKIIGIILATVLALALIVVCLVMFAPVRYHLNGSFHDEKPCGSFYAGWLPGLLSFRAAFDKDAGITAYIALFGHKIYDLLGNDDVSRSEADDGSTNGDCKAGGESNTANEVIAADKVSEADKSDCNQESSISGERDSTHLEAETEEIGSESKAVESAKISADADIQQVGICSAAEAVKNSEMSGHELSSSKHEACDLAIQQNGDEVIVQNSDADDKTDAVSESQNISNSAVHHDIAWHIGKLLRKISNIFRPVTDAVNGKLKAASDAVSNKIDETEAGIKTKLSELKEMLIAAKAAYDKRTGQLRELYALYKAERYQPAVDMLKKCIILLLKELKPRSGSGRLRLGFDDPYTTGQAMQAAALIYPVIGERIEIIPDFDNTIIDGDINIKGRIRLIVPTVSAIRIFFNRDLRAMYRKVRKILELDQ